MKKIFSLLTIFLLSSIIPAFAAFCANCGNNMPNNANFCPNCGKAAYNQVTNFSNAPVNYYQTVPSSNQIKYVYKTNTGYYTNSGIYDPNTTLLYSETIQSCNTPKTVIINETRPVTVVRNEPTFGEILVGGAIIHELYKHHHHHHHHHNHNSYHYNRSTPAHRISHTHHRR